MKDFWIFPGIVAILITTVYFQGYIFLVLLALMIWRILILKNKKLNLLVFIVGIIFLGRCFFIQQQHVITEGIESGVIFPDTLTVNGDSLSGELQGEKNNFRFNYRIKSQTDQNFWKQLDYPVKVEIKNGQIQEITPPRNIGEFDYQKYLQHKGIFKTIKIEEFSQKSSYQSKTIEDRINVLRIHIIKYLSQLPKHLKIHAQSLLVGYTESSERDFLSMLSILGVIHLFSLSGLHVLILLIIIRKLTSLLRIPVEWVDSAMLIVLPCYGILVGSKSGIWRAIVFVTVGIVCQKMHLSLSRLDMFAVALLICTFVYPFAILEMGGQLSFLLSFAIFYLYQKSNFLVQFFKMNLVSLPLICFYTYQFNWLTILMNVIFVPIFTYLILPITLLSSLSVHWSIWKTVDKYFDDFYRLLNQLSIDQTFLFITGKISVWLLIVLMILALFYIETKTFLNKYLSLYLLFFCISIFLNKFPLFGSVNLVDVGQGDSIVITTPLIRKTFLIDVGGKLAFPKPQWAKSTNSNQVEKSTIPFLKSRGISNIDQLFLTHKDVDHIGNLDTLLDKFKVKQVNFGVGLENNIHIRSAIKKFPNVKFHNLKQGDVLKDTIDWQVLWPKKPSIGENGDSLTLLAKMNNRNWLFTGDLDIVGEKDILSNHKFKVDYLKVGHHGSRTSTGDTLLKSTHPKIGFISSGINNRYGHPNKETLKRLMQHQVDYFNTAEYGMISWYYSFFTNKEKITTFLKGDVVENNRFKK